MTEETTLEQLERLEQEVDDQPRRAGPRIRLGLALLDRGDTGLAAAHLQLAARLEPDNTQAALIACDALVRANRERDAALLLSSHVHPQRADAVLSPDERALIEGLLTHDEPFVRSHVARATGRLRLVDVVETLEGLLDDPDGSVRLAAERSLARLRAH